MAAGRRCDVFTGPGTCRRGSVRLSKDAWRGLYRVEDLARVYAMVGKFDAAIDKLGFLLSNPGEMSIHLLQLDPAWKSLRNHPRFKKLIELDK